VTSLSDKKNTTLHVGAIYGIKSLSVRDRDYRITLTLNQSWFHLADNTDYHYLRLDKENVLVNWSKMFCSGIKTNIILKMLRPSSWGFSQHCRSINANFSMPAIRAYALNVSRLVWCWPLLYHCFLCDWLSNNNKGNWKRASTCLVGLRSNICN